jgi:hypothetical protein
MKAWLAVCAGAKAQRWQTVPICLGFAPRIFSISNDNVGVDLENQSNWASAEVRLDRFGSE